jgi:hypothetical protein
MSNNAYACDNGCDANVPDIQHDLCAPEAHFGPINYIAVTKVGYPLTNVSDPNEWAARLAANDDTKIQLLPVVGDMPEPESTEYRISLCRKVISNTDFTVNIEVDETNDTNYEFMRATRCNPIYLGWIITTDHIRGGNDGIEMNIVLSEIIDKDCKGLQKFVGKVTWTAQNFPFRSENVLP